MGEGGEEQAREGAPAGWVAGSGPARRVVVHVADGLVFAVLGYLGVLFGLAGLDGGLPPVAAAAGVAATALGVAALELGWWRAARWAGAPLRRWHVAATTGIVAGAWWMIPAVGYSLAPTRDRSFRWLPLDWVRLPSLLRFLARIDPLFVAVVTALCLTVVALAVLGRTAGRKGRVPAVLGAVALAVLYRVSLGWSAKEVPNLGPVLPMLLWPIVLATGGWSRGLARSLASFAPLLLITLYFFGAFPGDRGAAATIGQHVWLTRLYPRDGAEADYDRLFPRQMVLGPAGEALYMGFGATSGWASGLLRLPLDREAAVTFAPIEGGFRSLILEPDSGNLVGVDAPRAEVRVFGPGGLGEVERVDLFERGPVGDAISFVSVPGTSMSTSNPVAAPGTAVRTAVPGERPGDDRFYVLAYERAVVTEWHRRTWTLERTLDLHEAGATSMQGGGLVLRHDPARDRLYALLGPVDVCNRYHLVEIDRPALAVERIVRLPMGSTDMVLAADGTTIWVPEGYGDRIHEVDVRSWSVRRVLEGPRAGSRNLAHDPWRGVLYGLGWGTGLLEVTDLGGGEVVARLPVGKKPGSLAIDEDGSRLWVGSGLGILQLDLDAWAAARP